MQANAGVERWLIKLDHEFHGRGIAYIDMNELPPQLLDLDVANVIGHLQERVPEIVKFAHPRIWENSWRKYIASLSSHGMQEVHRVSDKYRCCYRSITAEHHGVTISKYTSGTRWCNYTDFNT